MLYLDEMQGHLPADGLVSVNIRHQSKISWILRLGLFQI